MNGRAIEGPDNRLARRAADVYCSEEPIVLLGRLVERPTAVKKRQIPRALVPGIRHDCGKARANFRRKGEGVECVEKDRWPVEAACEGAISDEEEPAVPCRW